ncbi:MAG TPA: Rnase Y domain-containing protein, partial [Ignavibacteriaceae bacterium]|nr:Rnase Y domain-containing protein [Ignavibacteriaceae bacterium]
MVTWILLVVVGASGLTLGFIITSTLLKKNIEKKNANIIKEAEEKGEVIKKEKILQAKEKFLQLKTEHEKFVQEKTSFIQKTENRLSQKDASLSQKFEELQRKQKETDTIKQNLSAQLELVSKKQSELDKSHKRQVEALEVISGMSGSEAKAQLIETLKDEAKSEAMSHITEI